jgi:hypothetical protein
MYIFNLKNLKKIKFNLILILLKPLIIILKNIKTEIININ